MREKKQKVEKPTVVKKDDFFSSLKLCVLIALCCSLFLHIIYSIFIWSTNGLMIGIEFVSFLLIVASFILALIDKPHISIISGCLMCSALSFQSMSIIEEPEILANLLTQPRVLFLFFDIVIIGVTAITVVVWNILNLKLRYDRDKKEEDEFKFTQNILNKNHDEQTFVENDEEFKGGAFVVKDEVEYSFNENSNPMFDFRSKDELNYAKLDQLTKLYDRGLLSKEDFDRRSKDVMDNLYK